MLYDGAFDEELFVAEYGVRVGVNEGVKVNNNELSTIKCNNWYIYKILNHNIVIL